MKYEVNTKFTFTGTVTIEADGWAQAKELLKNGCTANGNISKVECSDKPIVWTVEEELELTFAKARQVKDGETAEVKPKNVAIKEEEQDVDIY